MPPIQFPLSLSNLFLLPCQGGYLQVDTGYDRDYPLYRQRLSKAGIPIEKISYVFLTHHHDDHAGFLNQLVSDTGDLIIIAHKEAMALLQTGQNDKSRGGGYVNRRIKWLAGLKMRLDPHWTLSFPPFALRDQDLLVTGDNADLLPSLGLPGKILATPGHCIDHLALVMGNGDTFCGDAASSFLLWAGTQYCTLFMTDMEQAYQSWQKLLDAGAQQIYPTHGKPFPAHKLRQHMGRIKTVDLVRFF